jgi:hypothetical protein
MGLVQRDSIHRLRHAKGYSRQFDSFCTNMAWTGYIAGTGKLAGPDPREMAVSDQRRDLGHQCGLDPGQRHDPRDPPPARSAAQDHRRRCLSDETMKQADLGLILKPGTDAALACAAMHVLFRDGHADRDYLANTPTVRRSWRRICNADAGVGAGDHRSSVEEIEEVRAHGRRDEADLLPPRLRLHPRSRNGAVAMHAASFYRSGHRRLASLRAAVRFTTTARSISSTSR